AVTKADEEINMDQTPGEPCRPSAKMSLKGPLHIGNGAIASDGGHVALIEVVEGFARPAFQIGLNHPGGVGAHLHRRLRHAGNSLAVFRDLRQITADKDISV